MSDDDLAGLADESYCYLTTTGRVTERPREIEIWFGLRDRTLYMLSGGRDRSDWVRNLKADPRAAVRIADRTFAGAARFPDPGDEDTDARRLLYDKYIGSYSGDLEDWRDRSLVVAVDIEGEWS